MADAVVNQEPVDLQEILYSKSQMILANMLAPELKTGKANNYKIVKVERMRGYSAVTVQLTKDPEVDIDTATADQIKEVTVDYEHHSLADVIQHFLGAGPHPVSELPASIEDVQAFIAGKTDKLSVETGITALFDGNEVSLFVNDNKDLRFYGNAHLTFEVVEGGLPEEPGKS